MNEDNRYKKHSFSTDQHFFRSIWKSPLIHICEVRGVNERVMRGVRGKREGLPAYSLKSHYCLYC